MPDIDQQLHQRFTRAIIAACGEAFADTDPLIRPSNNPKFGDFQSNVAMPLAKSLGKPPREIAQRIVEAFDSAGLCQPLEIAGPGFINIRLESAALVGALAGLVGDARLGVPPAAPPQTVVLDYASPNLAKEMHIGHLRSTIIGDAIGRVLEFQGQHVIRHNHVGDWGTQFGMLLEHLIDTGWEDSPTRTIGDLNTLYQQAKQRDDQDPAFAERARRRVVALQSGDPQALRIWQLLINESVRHMNDVFARLGVKLTDQDLKPESFYNDRLADVVSALEAAGVLKDSQGAKVAFVEGFKGADQQPLPLIVRKSDGGFGYAATDLAALRYRVTQLKADRLIYVVDSRQKDHFVMFFTVARMAGWVDDRVELAHVGFGTIMGKDRKPFKTREGGTVRLTDVLTEAISRAEKVIADKNGDLTESERKNIAAVVGIGAVKYADLSNDRIKDYVFDWDRMLALEGNTAPYLQNAYVRIRSIFRKGGIDPASLDASQLVLDSDVERGLALTLLKLPGVIESVASSLEPHRLCNYLYDLASAYHHFYEHCPVLKASSPALMSSRLILCDLVATTLRQGLQLLGIDTVEKM